MKRLAIIPTTFAFVAMVAACTDVTTPDVSEPLFRHGGDHMVPIKGNFAYSRGDDSPCAGAPNVSGPGEVSHLGTTTFEFSVDASCTLEGETFTIFGEMTLTAANGDAIFFPSSSASFDVSDINLFFATGGEEGSPFGAFDLTGEANGGTGRFAGATGEVSGAGVNNFLTASGTFSLNGTISSVGSSRQ